MLVHMAFVGCGGKIHTTQKFHFTHGSVSKTVALILVTKVVVSPLSFFFIIPNINSVPMEQEPPFLHSWWSPGTSLSIASMPLSILDVSRKCSHTVVSFCVCFIPFLCFRSIQVVACIKISFFSWLNGIPVYVFIPRFVNLFISWRLLGLLPLQAYCE